MPSQFDPGKPFAAAAEALREAVARYAPLSAGTWRDLLCLCRGIRLSKNEYFCLAGEVPTRFGFVQEGLLRVFVSDEEGNEYNKVFFAEGTFPGSMSALLTRRPSGFAIQALEETRMLSIDFAGYRRLLRGHEDLLWFHIRYLERHWLLEKEPREVALVQEDAAERYRRFRREHPQLLERLPLYQVASHLGITPTQLSRIRKAARTADSADEKPETQPM